MLYDAVETSPPGLAARYVHPGAANSPSLKRRLRVDRISTLEAHLHDMLHADLYAVVGKLRDYGLGGEPDPRTVAGLRFVAVYEEMIDAGFRKALLHLGRGAGGDDEIGRAQKFAL